ncbi:MAG: hypothetical protein KGL39_27250 [Patescibacteria group bacterium]|nr:hypothetical protein [Patescibacteria group bacterium]
MAVSAVAAPGRPRIPATSGLMLDQGTIQKMQAEFQQTMLAVNISLAILGNESVMSLASALSMVPGRDEAIKLRQRALEVLNEFLAPDKDPT